eukprot:gene18507-24224_t
MSIETQLNQIITSYNDIKDQITYIQLYIDEIIKSNNINQLQLLISRLLSNLIPQQVLKVVVLYVANNIRSLINNEDFEQLGNNFISLIRQQQYIGLFDETEYVLRNIMFDYYINTEQFKEAALILSQVNFESSSYSIPPLEIANIFIKCAECSLEDDETVDAEVYVNRASQYMNDITDRHLQLRYRVTSARVLDANRKFLEASLRYYDLSITTDTEIVQDDLLELLGKAITCVILAKAGPQRTRVLAQINKDDRLGQLEQLPKYSIHSNVLNKMSNEQLLRKDELNQFIESLAPHQKAMTSEGFTIPEKAVIEHNLIAISKIYENIRFDQLAVLLGMNESKAEKVSAKMIIEERLKAVIDQSENLLIFEDGNEQLHRWDNDIKTICNEIIKQSNHITTINEMK